MRFEDMKNNIPETPEFIHVMIQNEVDRQLQEPQLYRFRRKGRNGMVQEWQWQQWSACWQLPQQLMRV